MSKFTFKERVWYHILKYFRPVMVSGYKRFDGVFLKNTRIGSTVAITGHNNFNISDNVFIGHHNFIEASNGVEIGTGCQLTNFISILTHSSHRAIRLYGKSYNKVGPMLAYGEGSVKIGSYTFVGPHCVIMPGTSIGKGSLVTAFSFVSGEFPDFAIISGNPAKVVGDTRQKDAKYLDMYPELKKYYDEWAG
jgi:acetyltransferase-like isoleucine patch superfamily enzyme